ncbi:2-succinyl-6-hydroxy-2,4-cyclohexadiene-1-carboxylate synthase [Pueribacillus theae]|uniref:Putative 2-succinyl-6-hydroxy-2,4-cyclohexadiene-1-carboxylate synthase n=1 Tax=Pueribacillus theae TaxID=2171751 RepID=A0A2U1JS53_9BACI|nr:2-succinyl-6-hydroxy-2,4-cyclohexadiene-1-carboxylate synthase [Pueribacillus theae]PWA08040.1 2-succinyl-6-hydroxy-2,4-cyclohexadiene-1-carboxylate synthase [Pueribacillus theae]
MFYQVNNLNLHVEMEGSGSPLLLLHGFTGSSHTWKPFIPFLSKKHTVIAIDMIGHGKSDAPHDPARYTLEKAADDTIALLDKMNIQTIHLLGYSMGGRLALMIACRYPDRISSLILESSSPGLKTEKERKARRSSDEKLAAFIEEKGITAFVDYWENIPLFQTQKRVTLEEREKVRANRLQNRVHGLANSLRGMGTGRQPSLWSCLPALNMPCLLLAGELDAKYVKIAKEMDKLLPRSNVTIFRDAGHTVHLEKSRPFVKTVAEFLHKIEVK